MRVAWSKGGDLTHNLHVQMEETKSQLILAIERGMWDWKECMFNVYLDLRNQMAETWK